MVICFQVLGCNFINYSRNSLKNDEITRMRMKDAIGTVINEECYGM